MAIKKITNSGVSNINLFFLLTAILVSCGFLIFSTKWGIGTSPDSAAYIGVANNLLSAKGLTIPYGNPPDQALTFYPPLYPFFLSLGGLTGSSLLQSTRWLHLAILSGNLILFWLYLRKLTHSLMPSLSVVLLIPLAISPLILNLHIMAWSEALFLLTGFTGLFLIAKGLSKESKSLVFIGGVSLGLACLTRYSGVALIASVTGAIFLHHKGKFFDRFITAVYAATPGVVLLSVWVMWTIIIGGNLANRSFGFHPIGINQLQQGLDTIASWYLIPLGLPGIAKSGILVLIAIPLLVVLQKLYKNFSEETKWNFLILIMFSIIYLIFLLISISFIDANTPLDDRILSPFFVASGLLVTAGVGHFFNVLRTSPVFKILSISLIVLSFSMISFTQRISVFQNYHKSGIGFSHQNWRESELINQLKQIPSDLTIYTNSPEGIYLLTGKISAPFPRKIDLTRQIPNPNFQEYMTQMSNEITKGDAIIAYFSSIRSKAFPDLTDINLLLPTSIRRVEYSDGLLIGSAD